MIAVADRGECVRDNEDWTKEVHVPGATSMEIEWDSQCRTESMLCIFHTVVAHSVYTTECDCVLSLCLR